MNASAIAREDGATTDHGARSSDAKKAAPVSRIVFRTSDSASILRSCDSG